MWKAKGQLKSKPGARAGCRAYHLVCASKHLENHCNEAGRNSTQQRLLEISGKRTKCEDEVTTKTE